MNNRDLQIIKDLERFRVMGRDDIVELYFSQLKHPINNANTVLKRLVRDKQIEVSRSFSPYVYFPAGSTMKRNSAKIPHFLELVNVYKQIKHYYTSDRYIIEPKYKKGLAEPDILTEIKGTPFFIEVQRNLYSQKVMDEKIKRYEALKYSEEFASFDEKKAFPFIIMISDSRYEINSEELTIFQVGSIHEFMENVKKKNKKPAREIKYKIG